MAYEAEASELAAFFERLLSRHRDLSLFIPFILGQDPDQETHQTANPPDRIILINPFTQGMVVIEGGSVGLDYLIQSLASKNGHPPASQASIEAMPSVVVEASEAGDGECVICLEDWEIGGVVKEMPCKHRFHPSCIDKWLGIHGSCPVCRFKMPVDDGELSKKRDEGEEGRERRRIGREIWVSFSLNDNRGNSDASRTPSLSDSNESLPSSPRPDHEMEG